MPISKVVFGGSTLIDLTNDTVTPNSLLSGYTAHDKAGNVVEGSLVLRNPSGSLNVNANGTYDVIDYAQVVVSFPTYDGTVV